MELSQWQDLSLIPDGGMLLGEAAGVAVLVVRRGEALHALDATCTHYGGPLSEGLFRDGTIRCPWHHARFDVETGRPVRAPALNPLGCWEVDRDGDRFRVVGRRATPAKAPENVTGPSSVVIVGAGAAGAVAAETLRLEGFTGPIHLVGEEDTGPVDRPNLSKDYLAGNAPEEWIPLRDAAFYAERRIDLHTSTKAVGIDPAGREVRCEDGTRLPYGALILATGASPLRLPIPGSELPHVHLLRTLADSRAIIERAKHARRALVIGASFIGLEVSASLRARGVAVDVVAPEAIPLQRVLGPDLGRFVQSLHEQHGVKFHLGRQPLSIDPEEVTLDDGGWIEADLVVMGVGVRPNTALAQAAGCQLDGGVLVDSALRTSVPGIWAAGDVARWPEPISAMAVRIEHWAVAEMLGAAAARSVLGHPQPFREVPFFWSQHYDVPINYVGCVDVFDEAEVAGNIADRNCLVAYRKGRRILAVASVFRDRDSLLAEDALQRGDQAALETLLRGVKEGP